MTGQPETVENLDPPLEHTPRAILELGVRRIGEWSIKLYGIAGKPPAVSQEILDAAASISASALPDPARTPARYGLGFVVAHEASAFNTVIVDWWERANELRHRVFRARPDDPLSFREITATGESVCVWELRVQAYERQAWLEHVLARPEGPDFSGYLAERLSEVS